MELSQIRCFYAVASCRSVTKGANVLGMSQSSVSKAVARLEDELGTSLFRRTGNAVSLTEAGELFFAEVSQALEHLENGVVRLGNTLEDVSGTLSVLMLENRVDVPKYLSSFLAKHPHVRLRVNCDPELEMPEQYDYCVSTGIERSYFDRKLVLKAETLQVAVHEGHPLARKDIVTLSDLRGKRLAVSSDRSESWKRLLGECVRLGFQPDVALVSTYSVCCTNFVTKGLGVGLVGAPDGSKPFSGVVMRPLTPEIRMFVSLYRNSRREEKRAGALLRGYLAQCYGVSNIETVLN